MKEFPTRKHPRLKAFDYSQSGAYFITFCVKDRHEMLGKLVGRDALGAPYVELSEYGVVVDNEIRNTPLFYTGVAIDKYIIMPNHVHMIVILQKNYGAPRASRPTTISTILAIIKRKTNKEFGFDLWQTSFHDHIIRSEEEYQMIW